MRPGAEHRFVGAAVIDRDQLKERFRRVIIGAGYSDAYAQQYLGSYFEDALNDLPNFLRMLKSYESGRGDD